jgi:hypothetical protein
VGPNNGYSLTGLLRETQETSSAYCPSSGPKVEAEFGKKKNMVTRISNEVATIK